MAFVQIVHLCFGQTASFGQIGSFQEVGCHFGHVYTCMPDLDDLFLSDPCAHGIRSLGRPVTHSVRELFETL